MILARHCSTTPKSMASRRGVVRTSRGCPRRLRRNPKDPPMPANKKLLILPGDGIGPEVMREVRRIIDWMDRRRMVTFDITDDHVGGSAIDTYGTPITHATMQKATHPDGTPFGPA